MTAYELAQRFVGEIRELPGSAHHPFIQWAHMLCALGPDQPDSVPWCSSWLNAIAWMLQLPRSRSAAARSWLNVGSVIQLEDAKPGNDIVILSRGSNQAQGHVGLFAGLDATNVHVLGGNQGDAVSIAPFRRGSVLGVRRLA